ncbi:MAG TPA: 3-phosphoshikimate 1-carboxyvinyltransferase, partial [Candidatus Hypogeohydataceae bacterium YC38]
MKGAHTTKEASFLEMEPGKVEGEVRVPGSKSLTNRGLLIAALAQGDSILRGALFSDDTHYMTSSLKALGFQVEEFPGEERFVVRGEGGNMPAQKASLFVGNAGTAMRFLTAFLCLGRGDFEIGGTERMHQRPIQDLLDCLNQLGARVKSRFGNGCPPVIIEARGLEGGRATMKGNLSSQYFTAVLLSAPYARKDVEIKVEGELVSRPYVDMTLRLMERFGVEVENRDFKGFFIRAGQRYHAMDYRVEGDATSASYFLAAAAITGGRVRVYGIPRDSLQGDVRFLELLGEMGARVERGEDWVELEGRTLKGIEADLRDCPDLAQTLAAVSIFAQGRTRLRNIENLRIKETDRIRAVVNELSRMGIKAREHEDGFEVEPGEPRPALIETYGD